MFKNWKFSIIDLFKKVKPDGKSDPSLEIGNHFGSFGIAESEIGNTHISKLMGFFNKN